MRAGIYTRLSHDPDGTSTATQRQQADCRDLCARRGWEVGRVYEDSDVSAYQRRVVRPQFEQLLLDVADKVIDVVVVWRSDRLARQPRDLERFLDVADKAGATLASVTEPFDGTHAGILMLRMVTSFAHHESAVKAERVARSRKESAERGDWPLGGRRMLGYTHDGLVVPEEAATYLKAVDAVLAGGSAWMVAAAWNEAGLTTPGGHRWNTSNFLRMLRSPRYAGIRVYDGVEISDGTWEALLPRDRWDALQRAVKPRRGPERAPRKYLLTGLLLCGRCGAPLAARPSPYPRYGCRSPMEGGCSGIYIHAAHLDDWISGMALARLSSGALDAFQVRQQGPSSEWVLRAIDTDERALEVLAHDHHVEKIVDRQTYLSTARELNDRLDDNRRQLALHSSVLTMLPKDHDALQAEWNSRGVPWRRAVLHAVIETITVGPGKKGRAAAAAIPARLTPPVGDIRWRG